MNKRRDASEIPILSPLEVAEICDRADNKRDECMIALLYLTGRRIGEILPLKKSDFNVAQKDFVLAEHDNIVSFDCMNEKVWRRKPQGNYSIEVKGNFKERKIDVEHNVFYEEYDIKYYEKIVPRFSMDGPSGKLLGNYVLDHLRTIEDDDYLFPPRRSSSNEHIKRFRAYQILRKLDNRLWLHAMRHINFTRMAELFTANPRQMYALTFHKQFESTIKYIHEIEAKSKLAKL